MWNALAVLLVATSLGPARSSAIVTNSQPTWSPDGKWIAFASDRGGSFDVWKTDGVRVRRVVRGGADPAWSPNGKTIAFVARDERGETGIYTADSSGRSRARRRVSSSGFQPSWSPDGRRIAFAAPTGGCDRGIGIWIADAGGGRRLLLIESPDEFTDYVEPAWSPDGKRIAYAIPSSDQSATGFALADVGGTTYGGENVHAGGFQPAWSPDGRYIVFTRPRKGGYGPLYVLDTRTLQERRLTSLLALGPAWSPGGKRIAFAARATDGSVDIYLINPDGSRLRRLTRQPPPSGPPGTTSDFSEVDNRDPEWSPDGGQIAFVTSVWRPPRQPTAPVLTVIGRDGKSRHAVTVGYSPTWSPDGKRLAFTEPDTRGAYLDVVDLDGRNRMRLVQTSQRESASIEPDWAPDGARIAFNDNRDGVFGIYVVDAAGGAPSLLARDGHDPDWSPDGSLILFSSYDEKENHYYLEVVSSDGTGRRRIAGSSLPRALAKWSPDGRRIVYESHFSFASVEVMNADGSDVRRLATGTSPTWSPDGSAIAYASVVGGHEEVATIPAGGGTSTRITYGGCTVIGTDFADVLTGGATDDVICAFGGRDTIDAGAGDDRILGGNDADRIVGGPGRDALFGEDGADQIDGGPGSDVIHGGKDADRIHSADGQRDVVDGEEGVDCATADAGDSLASIERRPCRG